MRRYIHILVKISLAVVFLWFLKSSGRLNFGVLGKLGVRPILLTFPLYMLSFLIGIQRWWMIIRAFGLPISWTDTVRLAMSGNWVSAVVPGGSLFSGDIARTAILALENKRLRGQGLASVVVDRAAGSLAILVIFLLSLAANADRLLESPWLRFLALAVLSSIVVIVSVLILLSSARMARVLHRSRLLNRFSENNIFKMISDCFSLAKHHLPDILKAHFISYLGHGATMAAIILLAKHIGIHLDSLADYLLAISLGMISAMVPISGPAGVGAGNLGFALSFALVNSRSGGDLALIWQLTFILASQTGLFFFLLNRRRSKSAVIPTLPSSISSPRY
jgi:uncharacterized membrane protein YbhN (UPF0104 family)